MPRIHVKRTGGKLRVGDRVKVMCPDKGSKVANWAAGHVFPGTEGTVIRIDERINQAYIDWDETFTRPNARTRDYAIDLWLEGGQFERVGKK